MWPFGTKKTNTEPASSVAGGKDKEGEKPDVASKPNPAALFSRPAPPEHARALRNPIYDTEWVLPGGNPLRLFQGPMGQMNARGLVKTDLDTNLWLSGQLVSPVMFDWYQWRTEFSPNVPFEAVLNFRFASRLFFRFGERVWFSVPLSYVPFTAYRSAKEIKQIAPVLFTPDTLIRFAEAWDKAQIVKPGEEPKGADLLKDPCGIYKTEESRLVLKQDNRPVRIKAGELFAAEIWTDWTAPFLFPGNDCAVRLYLEGFIYVFC